MSTNDSNFSGLLGEAVTVRKVQGRLVVRNRPKRKSPKPTEKITAARERFQEAAQYASQQLADPEANALYSTGVGDRFKSVFTVAMTDYLLSPRVTLSNTSDYKGAVGNVIVIKAVDAFRVARVKVIIADADGAVIEEGDAEPTTGISHLWTYRVTVANSSLAGTTIKAIAYDRPGNQGTAEVKL